MLFVHGLGWTFGSFNTQERVVRGLAANTGAAVFPEYPLAPELPYPTELEESPGSLAWARKNAAELGLDNTRVAIFGYDGLAETPAARAANSQISTFLREQFEAHAPR